MPTTYAVLGGTGSTGSNIIRSLLSKQDCQIQIYVRSAQKLADLIPAVVDNARVTIVEGSFNDSKVVARVLQNANVIFTCIASNISEPGRTPGSDTAASVIAGLQTLRTSNPSYKPPTIVTLSSGSVNDYMTKQANYSYLAAKGKSLFYSCLYYCYEDLRQAEQLYASAGPDLLHYISASAPALMPGDTPTGHRLSLESTGPICSFADLAEGMIEMSGRSEFWGKGVGVIATGETKMDWGPNIGYLLKGFTAYWMPWVWKLAKRWELW